MICGETLKLDLVGSTIDKYILRFYVTCYYGVAQQTIFVICQILGHQLATHNFWRFISYKIAMFPNHVICCKLNIIRS